MSSEGSRNIPRQRETADNAQRIAQRLLQPGIVDVKKVQMRQDRAEEPAERSRAISRLLSRYSPSEAERPGSLLLRRIGRKSVNGEMAVADGTFAVERNELIGPQASGPASGVNGSGTPDPRKKQAPQNPATEKGQNAGEANALPDGHRGRPGSPIPLIQRLIAPGLISSAQARKHYERIAPRNPHQALADRLQARSGDAQAPHPDGSGPAPADHLPRTADMRDASSGRRNQASPGAPGPRNQNTSSGNSVTIQNAGGPMQRGVDSGLSSPSRPLKELFRKPQTGKKDNAAEAEGTESAAQKSLPQGGAFRVMRKKLQYEASTADMNGTNAGKPGPGIQKSEGASDRLPAGEGTFAHRSALSSQGGRETALPAAAGQTGTAMSSGKETGRLQRKTEGAGVPQAAREKSSFAPGQTAVKESPSDATMTMSAASTTSLLMKSPAMGQQAQQGAERSTEKTTRAGYDAIAGADRSLLPSASERTISVSTTTGSAAEAPLMRTRTTPGQNEAPNIAESGSARRDPDTAKKNETAAANIPPQKAVPSVPEHTGGLPTRPAARLLMRAAIGHPDAAAGQRSSDGPAAGIGQSSPVFFPETRSLTGREIGSTLLQRQAKAREKAAGHASTAIPAQKTAVEHGSARAPESQMIWRKSERAVSQTSAWLSGADPTAMRSVNESMPARATAAAPPAALMPAGENGFSAPQGNDAQAPAAWDLDLLAEQVGRLLFRRMETERERRGVRF